MKKCSKCKQLLSKENFYKRKTAKDGLRSVCIECERRHNVKYYTANTDQEKARTNEYRKTHLDLYRGIDRNREKTEKRKRWREQWAIDNPSKKNEYGRSNGKRRRANGKAQEYMKLWRSKNREKNLIQHRKDDKKRRGTLKGRIDHNFSTQIWIAIKQLKRGRRWEKLVEYTLDELIARLTLTMPEGYQWDDYLHGKLHVDHIMPKCSFKYESTNDDQFKKCWSLQNLQLLPAAENLKKGSKVSIPKGG